eukprot:SAG31_NODE_13052_length_896_cov_0.969887_1_plen_265_part_10
MSKAAGTGQCQELRKLLSKYFNAGQQRIPKPVAHAEPPEDITWLGRTICWSRPRLVGIAIPALIVHVLWWSYMINNPSDFELFGDSSIADDSSMAAGVGDGVAGYWASITMVFGSIVAGATSVGGGAVAFPVFTLALEIPPLVARDFSMMIQAVGMISATFTILYQQIVVDWRAIIWCTFGGTISCPIALWLIAPYVPAPVVKMGFVSTWFAFSMALYLLNRKEDRRTFTIIHRRHFTSSHRIILFVAGLVGGVLTGLSGSGMDI